MAKHWQNSPQIPDVVTRLSLMSGNSNNIDYGISIRTVQIGRVP
jgi:hypothetical protein